MGSRRARFAPNAWTGLVIGFGVVLLLVLLRPLMPGHPLMAPWLQAPTPMHVAAIPADAAASTGEAGRARFVSFVLDDVQATWSEVFERHDLVYEDAKLVLYRGSVDSPCGAAPAASGPFYCHDDGNVYLDLASYDGERERRGMPVEAAGPTEGDERWSFGAGRAPPGEAPAHSTTEPRWSWFRIGLDGGDPSACDAFSAP